MEREISEMKQRLEEMHSEEKELDQSIQELNNQIRREFLENEEMREYHYITHEDLVNIYKSMNRNDTNKSMVVIAAPKGTTLEMGEQDHGEHILKMDSTGKGRIRVYNCNAAQGVREVELSKEEQQ